MMTRAYSELYLEDAMNNLGEAFDYAANACSMDKDLFMSFFINTDMSYSFERGNPMVIAGMSGTELVQKTLAKCRYRTDFPDPLDMLVPTEDFWCGWILAYAQWSTGYTFRRIMKIITIKEIETLYPTLHEAPEERFVDMLKRREKAENFETNLRLLRENKGISQAELARRTGVSLRAIQQYEQKQKDINKAQTLTLYNLAKEFDCSVEALMEI